jgi:hypothetical protein
VKLLDAISYRGTPPVLRTIYRRCFWASVVVVILTIAFIIVRDLQNWPRKSWAYYLPVIGGFLPGLVILPWGWWLRRRILRDWRISRGRLCTHCAYNVSALAPAGTCPECGNAYDSVADAATWSKVGLKVSSIIEA